MVTMARRLPAGLVAALWLMAAAMFVAAAWPIASGVYSAYGQVDRADAIEGCQVTAAIGEDRLPYWAYRRLPNAITERLMSVVEIQVTSGDHDHTDLRELAGFPELKTVVIGNATIAPGDLKPLAEVKQLQTLWILGAFADPHAVAMECAELRQLQRLDLRINSLEFSREDIAHLRSSLRHTTILLPGDESTDSE